MHTSSLTETDYTPIREVLTTGGSPMHQDIVIHRDTLLSGELQKRLDTVAYPQLGISFAGTVDGKAFPRAAKALPVSDAALSPEPPIITAPIYIPPFSDDFGRPDGPVGNGWVDATAPGASNCPTVISSHRAVPQTAGKGNTMLRDLRLSLGLDVSANFVGADDYKVLMFSSLLDQSHYLYVAVNNANTYLSITGTNHTIGSGNGGVGTVRVTVSASGLVTVYFNGTSMGTYQLSSDDLTHLGTYAGVGTYNQAVLHFAAQAL